MEFIIFIIINLFDNNKFKKIPKKEKVNSFCYKNTKILLK